MMPHLQQCIEEARASLSRCRCQGLHCKASLGQLRPKLSSISHHHHNLLLRMQVSCCCSHNLLRSDLLHTVTVGEQKVRRQAQQLEHQCALQLRVSGGKVEHEAVQ
eukprot:GHRQ01032864.1.p2 GENE.GHRQ01032864.1~~GHRQ01032864.1.p2  ORF type:complete len:106 (-),score=19.01 GHRQ01032864.1:150-467(-)